MARRVDQASNVAPPLEATARPFHIISRRRFSACNSATDTVSGLPDLKKATGAGDVSAPSIGVGAKGSSKLASGSVAGSRGAASEGKGSSNSNALVEAVIAEDESIAAFSAD